MSISPPGRGVLNTIMDKYSPMAGEILMRESGALLSYETGSVIDKFSFIFGYLEIVVVLQLLFLGWVGLKTSP